MPGTRAAFLSERWPSETFVMENVTGCRRRPPSLRSAMLGQDSPSPGTSRVGRLHRGLGSSDFGCQWEKEVRWASLCSCRCALGRTRLCHETFAVPKTRTQTPWRRQTCPFPTHRGTQKHPRAHTCAYTYAAHPRARAAACPRVAAHADTHLLHGAHTKGGRHAQNHEGTHTRTETGVQRSTLTTGTHTRPSCHPHRVGRRGAACAPAPWTHRKHRSHRQHAPPRPTYRWLLRGSHIDMWCLLRLSLLGRKNKRVQSPLHPSLDSCGQRSEVSPCPGQPASLCPSATGCWGAGAQRPAANLLHVRACTPAASCLQGCPRSHSNALHPDSHAPPWHTSLPPGEVHAAVPVLGMQIRVVGAAEPSPRRPAMQQRHGGGHCRLQPLRSPGTSLDI